MPSRPVESMPDDVEQELTEAGVLADYRARPFYQRNDYLSWIRRAKRLDTRQKRIRQMIDELDRGGVYMRMDHPPSRKG